MVARWVAPLGILLCGRGVEADARDKKRVTWHHPYLGTAGFLHALFQEPVGIKALAAFAGAACASMPRSVAQRRELRQRFVETHILVEAYFANKVRAVGQARVPFRSWARGAALLRRADARLVEKAVTTISHDTGAGHSEVRILAAVAAHHHLPARVGPARLLVVLRGEWDR